jgi:hypothetical protein
VDLGYASCDVLKPKSIAKASKLKEVLGSSISYDLHVKNNDCDAEMVDYNKPLEMREVPVPEVHGEEVLVKIRGSRLCHSDLHLMDCSIKIIPRFHFTLGHESMFDGGRQSKLVLVGLASGTQKLTACLVNELEVTTRNWGSISELSEVHFLLQRWGKYVPSSQKILAKL